MNQVKDQTIAELEGKLVDNLKLLLDLRFQKKLGNQVKNHFFRKIRRENARIKTLLTERSKHE